MRLRFVELEHMRDPVIEQRVVKPVHTVDAVPLVAIGHHHDPGRSINQFVGVAVDLIENRIVAVVLIRPKQRLIGLDHVIQIEPSIPSRHLPKQIEMPEHQPKPATARGTETDEGTPPRLRDRRVMLVHERNHILDEIAFVLLVSLRGMIAIQRSARVSRHHANNAILVRKILLLRNLERLAPGSIPVDDRQQVEHRIALSLFHRARSQHMNRRLRAT